DHGHHLARQRGVCAPHPVLAGPGIRSQQPVDRADAAPALDLLVEADGRPDAIRGPLPASPAEQPLIQLTHLLAERHPSEDVLDSLGDGTCRIAEDGDGLVLGPDHISLLVGGIVTPRYLNRFSASTETRWPRSRSLPMAAPSGATACPSRSSSTRH